MKYLLLLFPLMIFSLHSRADIESVELFDAINERLSYMEDVALFKAQKHLPIEDMEREKVVIEKAKKAAYDKGLDPHHMEEFFKAQIAVAKAIQYRYRADLLSQAATKEPKDLKAEVRPALLSLGDQIIKKIMLYVKANGSFDAELFAEFDAAINLKYVSTLDKKLLFSTLQKVKPLSVE